MRIELCRDTTDVMRKERNQGHHWQEARCWLKKKVDVEQVDYYIIRYRMGQTASRVFIVLVTERGPWKE